MRKFSEFPFERDKNDIFRLRSIHATIGNPNFLNIFRTILLLLFLYAILWGLLSPKNAFTTGLFWGLFWPFFMVITLPFLGNIFCMICPMGFLSRTISKYGSKRKIPKVLKNPYIGFSLLLLFYWIPLYIFPGTLRSSFATALFFLFFLILAVIVSFLYTNGAFCRYFCPIGRVAPAFARVGFMWLSAYNKKLCDSKCEKPDCAFACPYKLSPYKFDKNNSMESCTLCMECAGSCEGIKYSIRKWSYSLLQKIKKPNSWEIWIYIILLAVITITMRFHHGLGHSPIKDELPWVNIGKWLETVTGIGKPFSWVGFTALFMAVIITLSLVLGGFYITSKIIKKPFKEVFLNLGYALAPLMIIGSLSHVTHFFFTHYYHEIINGFSQAFFLNIEVEPLASNKDKWLRIFYIFPFIAAFWSGFIMWKRIGFFEISGLKKMLAYVFSSLIIVFYIALTVFQLYIRFFYSSNFGH
ncbi:4Fe-4S binding protein [Persephonella sp. KM09-Lau-8]|uniref:4Fe-4S binding protein n=1 Tax=Persephonella sp. KM09-Lau-8 TaxID=1158345 RepID=UPI00049647DE|nr:4Fe-4S binding protein [Persephonella sp. KM09-Lau-8]